jgi:hypothetical protein
LNPLVPLEVDTIVRTLLSKEPSQRYRTADQLGRILIQYRQQGEEATAAFPVMPSQPTRTAEQPAQEPEPEAPVPVMPPLDVGKYTRRDTNQHIPAMTAIQEVPEEEGEDTLVIDFYAIVLGLLALGAVLGLIPLWISVFSTFAR